MTTSTHPYGFVAPGFEEVRDEFDRNLRERGEIGAAVAAYWRGEKVVDLWGGLRIPGGTAPWNEDTMVIVNSTTKGLAAMTLALANARGWLDYDAPVAYYWPEFAQNGKSAITVRQLLAHEAGLVVLDEEVTVEKLRDLDYMAGLLARQKPAWPPGTRHGYHTMTIGLYMQEILRRVDPAGCSLGRFFRDEIASAWDSTFSSALTARRSRDERLRRSARAHSVAWPAWRSATTPPAVTLKMISPGSLLRKSFSWTERGRERPRSYLDVEVAGGQWRGGHGARDRTGVFRLCRRRQGAGISAETMAASPHRRSARARDEVLGIPSYFSLGFARPGRKPRSALPLAPSAPGGGRLLRLRGSRCTPGLRVRHEQAGLPPDR
jgi:CubicO group peptidase (beta-lactamase class C family)